MIIKQLSVFLENKSGRLAEVLETLGEKKINITAMAVADTSEYGILRFIAAEVEKARDVLKAKGFSVHLSDVLCIITGSEAGSFAKALKILSQENISIEYIYAFSIGNKAAIVMRTENRDKALEAIQKHNMELLKRDDLFNF